MVRTIHVSRFAGIRPAISDRNLDQGRAVVAHNTLLRDGSLMPFRQARLVRQEPGTVRTIYRPGDTDKCCAPLLTWDHCVSAIRPPDPGDCPGFEWLALFHHDCAETRAERMNICTGELQPLYVPAPEKAPILTLIGAGKMSTAFVCEADNGCNEHKGPDERAYIYTWVDKFGVESRPSAPSQPVLAYDDQTFLLSGFDTPPPNAVCVRIYRTTAPFSRGENPSTNFNTSWQLVEEVPLPLVANQYLDDRRLADICWGTLQTIENCDAPPCFEQVVMTESGYAVGFHHNKVFVSERYNLHNWPERNRLTLADRIVGMAVNYDIVYFGTTGRPYRMNVAHTKTGGESDVTADPVPYNEPLPLLQREAITVTSFGAAYVTKAGIVGLRPTGAAQLISHDRIDEDRWWEYVPNVLVWHRGRLVGVRAPAGKGIIYDISEGQGALELGDVVTVDLPALTLHAGRDDHLYFANDGDVWAWHEGHKPMPYRWRSRTFVLPALIGMAAAKVVGRFGAGLTFRLYAKGNLVYVRTVHNCEPFRLPAFGRHLDYVVELEGTTRVDEVHVGPSVWELTEK